MKTLFVALLAGSFALTAFAADPVPIRDFYEVSPGIYRGARPERVGVAALARMGVKYILNIDNDSDEIRRESVYAKDSGIRMISRPMSGFWTPDDKQVDGTLAILADGRYRPIFVHCQYGHDRTGLIVGLHRVFHDGWHPQRAYTEMVKRGFHPSLFLLKDYFEDKTGWEDLSDWDE